jgi:hypothetical protein
MMPDITVPDFTPHEPNSWCGHLHCFIHNIDELSYPSYMTCGECHHVYLTARALRRAERRFWWGGRRFVRRSRWLGLVFRVATVRASRIYDCAHCGHDF